MKNLIAFQQKLAAELHLVDMLESANPQSVKGVAFKSDWMKGLQTAKINVKLLNMFLSESYPLTVQDPVIKEMYDTVFAKLSETPIKSKLAIMAENIGQMSDTEFNKLFAENLATILEHDEELIIRDIKNGVFDNFTTIPGVAIVLNEARKDLVVTEKNDVVSLYNPVTYIEENSDNMYFRYNSTVFELSENGAAVSKAPSDKFVNMSNIVEYASTQFDREVKEYHFPTKFGSFTVSEDGLRKGDLELTVEEFITKSSIVIEAHDSKVRRTERHQADIIVGIAENFNNIVEADCLLVAENINFAERIGLLVHKNHISVMTFESNRRPVSTESFKSISEAVARFKILTTVDVTEKYQDLINAEKQRTAENIAAISEKKSDIDKVVNTINVISEDFALTEVGSDAHIKLTEAVNKAKILKLQLEQELSELLK